MHGFRTILGMNQRNAEAERIVANADSQRDEAAERKFAQDAADAAARVAPGALPSV
jgi:hypothetical protein